MQELDGLKVSLPEKRIYSVRCVAPEGTRLKINFDAAFKKHRRESRSGRSGGGSPSTITRTSPWVEGSGNGGRFSVGDSESNKVAHVIASEGLIKRETTYLEKRVPSGAVDALAEDWRWTESRGELRAWKVGDEAGNYF
ncbi:hypothetical protein GOBAR_AA17223 [Gossypium barbadense]|uniref:Uncharacterized protein n=1 Tax=Gossypium barbadense TaxID=3634 RepID=A0A2P5XJB2_GOSBA|nr:hypothetical protein GOBAR_AA17223 [Gossypium barbadense]